MSRNRKSDPNRINPNTGIPVAIEKAAARAHRKKPAGHDPSASLQKIQLNSEVPFVKAVQDFIAQTKSLDSAFEILLRSEAKHHLAIWKYGGNSEGDRCVGTLEASDELRHRLYAFLDDCPFVMDGSDFDAVVSFEAGPIYVPSHRGWGQTLAEWANSRLLGGKADWTPQIFAFYTSFVLENAADWAAALRLVIDRKGVLP